LLTVLGRRRRDDSCRPRASCAARGSLSDGCRVWRPFGGRGGLDRLMVGGDGAGIASRRRPRLGARGRWGPFGPSAPPPLRHGPQGARCTRRGALLRRRRRRVLGGWRFAAGWRRGTGGGPLATRGARGAASTSRAT